MKKRVGNRAWLGLVMVALGLVWIQLQPRPVRAVDPGSPKLAAKVTPPEAQATPRGTAQLVVLVSIDGLRPDVITPQLHGMHRLFLQGAYPHFARTIDKSATLPSHASMVSGVDEAHHGLDFNSYRPDRGTIVRPTLFSLAHEAGLPTAMFVGKAKLKHLLGHPTDAQFKMAGMLCEKLLKEALPTLERQARGVLFLHFADPDSAGHRHGWMTEEYLEAVRTADRCLDRVISTIEDAGRADSTLLIVTSDHGGHNKSHGTRLDVDQRIPWYAWGAGVRRGRMNHSVHTTDTAATVLQALGIELPKGMSGQPVLEALAGNVGPQAMPLMGGTPIGR